MADLLRRAGRFDESIARAEAGIERASLHTRRVLLYIIALAAREDSDAHSSAEATPPTLSS